MFGLLACATGLTVGQSLIAACVSLTTVLGCAKLGLATLKDYQDYLAERCPKKETGE